MVIGRICIVKELSIIELYDLFYIMYSKQQVWLEYPVYIKALLCFGRRMEE